MKKTSILKLSLIAAASATLVACGGGGGGGGSISAGGNPPPVVTPTPNPIPPVVVTPTWDYSSGQTYNSGDRAKTAGGYETTIGERDRRTFSQVALHSDVVQARADGWTGKDVEVLVVDEFEGANSHGNKVSNIINRNAPGAIINKTDLINTNLNTSTGREKILNYSLGTLQDNGRNELFIPGSSTNLANFVSWGLVAAAHQTPNAVVVKAAGNENQWASYDWSNYALSYGVTYQNTGVSQLDNLITNDIRFQANVNDRLLIVGALDKDGTVNNKANLAFYSNKAGELFDRFLVANGCEQQTCSANSPDQGTSYAAPRVASYAALVQHKFQNLTPQQTSDILLRTARTDTINNYNVQIHGRGEASLSRALSPIGKLR